MTYNAKPKDDEAAIGIAAIVSRTDRHAGAPASAETQGIRPAALGETGGGMGKSRKQRKLADSGTESDGKGDVRCDVADVALFLVRIFGAEAREIAADRAKRSDQAEEWRRVLTAVESLLDGDAASSGRRANLH